MVQEVTDSSFEKDVLKSDKAVIIDFWANWCAPCRAMAPIFEELSKEMPDVKFVKIDVDDNQHTASKYNIMSIPAFLIFNKGKEIGREIGGMPKAAIKARIKSHLLKS